MNNTKTTINVALVSAFLVIGAVVVSAVSSNYSGDIQLRFGADGIQVQVDGGTRIQADKDAKSP